MSLLLKVDLVNNPEMALNTKIATEIMMEGMTKSASLKGDFTGKCLEMYFNNDVEDWVNARRIINGRDKAITIANYSKKFYKCLKTVS